VSPFAEATSVALDIKITEYYIKEFGSSLVLEQSDYHPCIVFLRFRVRFSDRRPAILTDVYVAFLNPPRKMLGYYIIIGHDS
jgi:hypothetical protein